MGYAWKMRLGFVASWAILIGLALAGVLIRALGLGEEHAS